MKNPNFTSHSFPYRDFPTEVEPAPAERPPAYEDLPDGGASSAQAAHPVTTDNIQTPSHELHYHGPPHLPWSTHDRSLSEIRTRFPNYSSDARALFNMIVEQSAYPPSYFVQLHGKHNETRQTDNKEIRDEVTDFYFRIDITHLLGPLGSGDLQCLSNSERGYRGTCFPSLRPTLTDNLDAKDALFEWCQRYVADSSRIKSFTFTRKIQNHDTQKLYELLRKTIAETNYRGQLYVTFPKSYCKLIVYSPGVINKWRMTTSIRWLFYLSFLWILVWPILILFTSRYKTVKSVFYYADSSNINDPSRNCKVISEVEWLRSWEKAIKYAALTGINTGDGALSDDYRIAAQRHELTQTTNSRVLSNAPNIAFVAQSVYFDSRLATTRNFNSPMGWGGDS